MTAALDMLRAIARAGVAQSLYNETNENDERTPAAEQVSSLNSFVSLSPCIDAEGLEERAALIEFGAVPRAWADGYAALSTMPTPAGFSPDRWQRIVDAAGRFLDRWAGVASACGWSDLDVFGCNQYAPDRRFDCMGLVLLLDRCDVASIDETGADLVTKAGVPQCLRFRRRPQPAGTISLWELIR
jgi:hypothetical protein